MTSPTVPASPAAPGPAGGAGAVGAGARRPFPAGFVWGAATAAYQVEGAVTAGGRTPSIWDTFSHTPGRVLGGATGDVACDHYHRLDDDLDLLAWLGVGAYRFSVSWTRWMPEGRGPVSAEGAGFYDRLVDGLLSRGIQPWATLYHWDLPQVLQDAGGWPERDTAHRFAEYADSVGSRLGDRVEAFLTLNEPWCSAFLGYASGLHAPGVQDDAAAVRAVHHLLLGHGEAVTALRLHHHPARLGIALNVYPVEPLTSTEEDRDAARRIDGLANRIVLDPLLRGDYPVDVVADLSSVTDFGHVRDGDLAVISAPLDLLGENYYNPHVVAASNVVASPGGGAAQLGAPEGWRAGSPWVGARDVRFARRGGPLTTMGWEVVPQGLPDVLLRLAHDYDCPPLYVTENGSAFADVVTGDAEGPDGAVSVVDPHRAAYLESHLDACLDAIGEGVDLRGYFAWSFLDNFEWAWGYAQRFGLVYVDYGTQRRIPKSSAHYLRDVIRENALRRR